MNIIHQRPADVYLGVRIYFLLFFFVLFFFFVFEIGDGAAGAVSG